MIGYILQAVLLIFFVYIISFRVKQKSIGVFVITLIISMLCLLNVMTNIYMIIKADHAPLDAVFINVFTLGWITRISTGVAIFFSLILSLIIGARSSRVEDINYSLKDNQGDNALQYLTPRVYFEEIFPKNGKWILSGVYCLILLSILSTVFLSGYSNQTLPQNLDTFAELSFELSDADIDKEGAVNLLEEVYCTTTNQDIKDILDEFYQGENLSVLFYEKDFSIGSNYYRQLFYEHYIQPHIITDYNDYNDITKEIGLYNVVGYEFYKIEGKKFIKYNIFIAYGQAWYAFPDDETCPLINISCNKSIATLSYAPMDLWGSKNEFKFEYEFIEE